MKEDGRMILCPMPTTLLPPIVMVSKKALIESYTKFFFIQA
jgi:hypothetical protein